MDKFLQLLSVLTNRLTPPEDIQRYCEENGLEEEWRVIRDTRARCLVCGNWPHQCMCQAEDLPPDVTERIEEGMRQWQELRERMPHRCLVCEGDLCTCGWSPYVEDYDDDSDYFDGHGRECSRCRNCFCFCSERLGHVASPAPASLEVIDLT